MDLREIIKYEVENYLQSDMASKMLVGDKYYKVENDILNRKIEYGGIEKKINNKLAHGTYKELVDEKVNYLLGQGYTVVTDKKTSSDVATRLQDDFLKGFEDTLIELGFESSNKGIGWLQVYIDSKGKLCFDVINAEQIIPLWADDRHKKLDGVIRVYNQAVIIAGKQETVTKVEYWDADKVEFYEYVEGELILDSAKYLEKNYELGHFEVAGEECKWGCVPFIPFKNNLFELPDIQFVKSIVDNYDLTRSDVANFTEEIRSLVYVLKGYDQEEVPKLIAYLSMHGGIGIDEEADLSTLNPTIDIEASRIHYEQLKRDIIEFGQGVPKDLDKFGNSPSGVALKMLMNSLNIKCNAMERAFKSGFNKVLEFVDYYCLVTNQSPLGADIDIIFNREQRYNEAEIIESCNSSVGIVSKKTILANHPFVEDVDQELLNLEEEEPQEDILPVIDDEVAVNE